LKAVDLELKAWFSPFFRLPRLDRKIICGKWIITAVIIQQLFNKNYKLKNNYKIFFENKIIE
jgi:hypothetical protein